MFTEKVFLLSKKKVSLFSRRWKSHDFPQPEKMYFNQDKWFYHRLSHLQRWVSKRITTNLKCDLQSVPRDLQDSSLWQLTRDTHPRVGSKHGAPQLLAGNNHNMVGNHWKTEQSKCLQYITFMKSEAGPSGVRTLTDGCEYVGEAEVIHSIKGQEMVEKLLFLIITAEESVSLVKFPLKKQTEIRLGWCSESRKKESTKRQGQERQTRQPFWPSSQSDINYEARCK